MSLTNSDPPPGSQEAAPAPRAPATTGGSGGGCLPLLLLLAALWFYFEVWADARRRMERMEAAVRTLRHQVDSLRTSAPPPAAAAIHARDTPPGRTPGDTAR